ncbi:putative transposase IS605 family protein [Microseira wollei NIES-4236]|uniref:Transposase IS605 family protein n=1 Tax=Microseira wollei NIES-4236 TaxID=2530354 RepID=A0AAV3XQC7_9CYAN|nr:transposase [Microseira wollei]GET44598.1 putative transposase IS605 family protein [Microseira wollei NIES-4236]
MMRKCHVRFLGEGDKATCSPLPDYITICLEDVTVPRVTPDTIAPNWDNSMGLDAVLHEDVYLATSEGELLPSFKPLRRNQAKLDRISQKRNKRKRGSRCRRKLAKRESKQHQRIARSRKDFQYKTAHKVVSEGKKFFFHEDLNLRGLSKRNSPKQDENGKYLPNGQSAKSGLNKSWIDADERSIFSTTGQHSRKSWSSSYFSKSCLYLNGFVLSE